MYFTVPTWSFSPFVSTSAWCRPRGWKWKMSLANFFESPTETTIFGRMWQRKMGRKASVDVPFCTHLCAPDTTIKDGTSQTTSLLYHPDQMVIDLRSWHQTKRARFHLALRLPCQQTCLEIGSDITSMFNLILPTSLPCFIRISSNLFSFDLVEACPLASSWNFLFLFSINHQLLESSGHSLSLLIVKIYF